jgi:hypothetical protein
MLRFYAAIFNSPSGGLLDENAVSFLISIMKRELVFKVHSP